MPRTISTPVVRLVVVVVLAVLCLSSPWFKIQAKGTFSEAIEREPTLWANYTIDGQEEVIELEISNSTPLIVYWTQRETITDSNGSNSSESPTTNVSKQDEEVEDDGSLNLSSARNIVKSLVTLCCLLELLCVIKPQKLTRGLVIGFWFAGLFALAVLIPISVISGSLGDGGEGADEGQPGDGFDTGEESGAEQFAHNTFESNLDVHLSAIVWSFDSSGYDLGLVEEQHRDSVRQSPPDVGEPGADSFLRFAGKIEIVVTDGVWIWLAIPIFWILITIMATMSTRLLSEMDGTNLEEGQNEQPGPECSESE